MPPQGALTLGDNPTIRILLPVGRPWSAIAAGYVGLLSPLALVAALMVDESLFILLFAVPAILAIALGVVALRSLRRHPELAGRGRAMFALLAGCGSLALTGLIRLLNSLAEKGQFP
jgi:hypothetical protein